ncbi:MAG: hypothetical protein ACXWOL_13790 [Ktedonobacteraceae bacterium]
MMIETARLIQSGNLKIPLLLSFVRASFPSPADDYKERPLDLDELVIQHPEATFYVRVSGATWIVAQIRSELWLIISSSSGSTYVISTSAGRTSMLRN